MAKASKPVSLSSKHLTKEEIEARQEAEDKLKGNDDKVYKPLRGMNPLVAKIYVAVYLNIFQI